MRRCRDEKQDADGSRGKKSERKDFIFVILFHVCPSELASVGQYTLFLN